MRAEDLGKKVKVSAMLFCFIFIFYFYFAFKTARGIKTHKVHLPMMLDLSSLPVSISKLKPDPRPPLPMELPCKGHGGAPRDGSEGEDLAWYQPVLPRAKVKLQL